MTTMTDRTVGLWLKESISIPKVLHVIIHPKMFTVFFFSSHICLETLFIILPTIAGGPSTGYDCWTGGGTLQAGVWGTLQHCLALYALDLVNLIDL